MRELEERSTPAFDRAEAAKGDADAEARNAEACELAALESEAEYLDALEARALAARRMT